MRLTRYRQETTSGGGRLHSLLSWTPPPPLRRVGQSLSLSLSFLGVWGNKNRTTTCLSMGARTVASELSNVIFHLSDVWQCGAMAYRALRAACSVRYDPLLYTLGPPLTSAALHE